MKSLLIPLCIAACIGTPLAQNTMQIGFPSGSVRSIPCAMIEKITFSPTHMIVNGPGDSALISDIAKVYFVDVPTPVSRGTAFKSIDRSDVSVAFSPSKVLITFSTDQPGIAAISVSDSRGMVVKTIQNGTVGAGKHTVAWRKDGQSGAPVPPGVYLIHALVNGKQTAIKQLVF